MYLNYYHLEKKPFELTPNPEFIYYSDIHLDVFKTIVYGIESGKGFIVLVGPVGSGKTTICRLLVNYSHQKENSDKMKIAYIFNPSLSFLEILTSILNDLGVRYKKKETSKLYLLDILNKFLIKEFSNNCKIVVIIDEAQLLNLETIEELRLLTNLETDNQKLLQIIICGQENLDEIIHSPRLEQLKQRINLYCRLKPLQYNEIEKYISHRMKIAGAVDSLKFTRTALNKLFDYSKGIPRKINSICDKALLSAYALNKDIIDYECIEHSINITEGFKKNKFKNKFYLIMLFIKFHKKTILFFCIFIIIIFFVGTNINKIF